MAIIMDGNGRWAQARGLQRMEGHRAGVERTDEIINKAHDMGLQYLTLFAFSKENWERPVAEVETLMTLLDAFLKVKLEKMLANGIRLNTIGDISLLPKPVSETLEWVKKETEKGQDLVLTLALSYGSRDEILRAVQKILKDKPQEINEEIISNYLDTNNIPDPDLIIRTSGEYRISNFLLWQGAYSEYFFADCPWPDFTPEHFEAAIDAYLKRERRFGKTGEQMGGI